MTAPEVTDFEAESTDPGEIELTWADVLGDEGRYHIRIRRDTTEIVE